MKIKAKGEGPEPHPHRLPDHRLWACPAGGKALPMGTEDTMKPALLIVDMQKAFHTGPAVASMDAACEYINAAAALFRKRGLPVVWIQNKDEYDKALPGLPGFDIVDGLKPLDTEPRVTKEYSNSFTKTDCKKILDSHGVDTVIVTGYAAEHCVLSTCRGARDLDLFSILLRGGLASSVPEDIGFVERISDVMSYGALLSALKGDGK
jgi:nicotinamidase-related amidase